MARTGRVSREQSDLNRNSIIATSSQMFRERGLDGVSLKDIMSAAGLTHGGFYGHFSSKDALEAIACEQAFEESRAAMGERNIRDFPQLVEYYLSSDHRDCPASGCAVAALATDVQRKGQDKPVHETYISGVRGMAEHIKNMQNSDPNSVTNDRHLMQFALMTGALMLARATRGDEISERFLAAAKAVLIEREATEE
ncbi:TetR/AcrR family transcriptional regulator [Pectobacterium zantedeschiae]|uniref:TetR/AcrR family transcriptional regulator n=1 Tax=Pectobacterium zantedeschiae TaxID=2034769 RepID=A0A9X8P4G0_9GAMM|nr:TetR/AcrR family transcriptional regulator [Pectobacterium zantedeschiae]RYC41746.1 TetR/AcrR family transcriptional regulator [Pectobacterium zantedeschiae]RYC46432.1 TetR family transcriptional regulator [Pectobacterium zantedeschiae]